MVVGTQIGILSIFNRKSGYGDCVDRIPGHPHSIDALCNVPSRYPNAHSTILTGSSDGLLRAVQLLPTKLLGVVADHGEFPIERIAVDRAGEGQWVGSVGHEEILKLTDLREVFEDDGSEEEDEVEVEDEAEDEVEGSGADVEAVAVQKAGSDADSEDGKDGVSDDGNKEESENENDDDDDESKPEATAEEGQDSSDEEVLERKRKKKKELDPFKVLKRSKGRNEMQSDGSFFAEL